MATIKAKNSAGEWVDVAASDSYERKVSQFNMVWVKKSSDKTFDLSPYLLEGDDFIIAYGLSGNSSQANVYLWCYSDGNVRPVDGETILLDNSLMRNDSPLEMIADTESRLTEEEKQVKYDAVTHIFSYEGARAFANYAALIYAG
jgi:hypothetical protein